jgi:RimJ/RimL family protein N-acetyltransferase
MMQKDYLFRSERLGFRNWEQSDLDDLARMNASQEVMEHFPSRLTKEQSALFLDRLQQHYDSYGYTYYAVDLLETGRFIGFIGLAYQDYETQFSPATDIGWRLLPEAWGKGYATEGAKRVLKHASEDLKLDYIFACCTLNNRASEKVMQKIGLQKQGVFKHPKLKAWPDLEDCLWYDLDLTQDHK